MTWNGSVVAWLAEHFGRVTEPSPEVKQAAEEAQRVQQHIRAARVRMESDRTEERLRGHR